MGNCGFGVVNGGLLKQELELVGYFGGRVSGPENGHEWTSGGMDSSGCLLGPGTQGPGLSEPEEVRWPHGPDPGRGSVKMTLGPKTLPDS